MLETSGGTSVTLGRATEVTRRPKQIEVKRDTAGEEAATRATSLIGSQVIDLALSGFSERRWTGPMLVELLTIRRLPFLSSRGGGLGVSNGVNCAKVAKMLRIFSF